MTGKLILTAVLGLLPFVGLVLALPLISTAVVIGIVVFWLFVPSWGPWLYCGVCLNLMRSRTYLLYVGKLNMRAYLESPGMMIQNGTSTELAIGGIVGAVRSFVGNDTTGAVAGGLIALLLFGLQSVLFPNPGVIASGDDADRDSDGR